MAKPSGCPITMAPKVILDRGQNRVARAKDRAQLGRLHDQKVFHSTLLRYRVAALAFYDWVVSCRIAIPATVEDLDPILCDYVETLWQEGEARNTAGDTLSGVSHFLRTRRQFPGAWQLLSVWQKLEMPARAPPLTAAMVLAIADVFRKWRHPDFVAPAD